MGSYSFKLPDIGEGIAEAEIVAWHVAIGDVVEEDAPLADVMTDKATVELTAPVAGKIVKIAGEAGEMIAIGSILAEFETEGEEAPVPSPFPGREGPGVGWPVGERDLPSQVRVRLVHAPPDQPLVRSGHGRSRGLLDVTLAEHDGFWAWAIIETLRHTGIFSGGRPWGRVSAPAFARIRGRS